MKRLVCFFLVCLTTILVLPGVEAQSVKSSPSDSLKLKKKVRVLPEFTVKRKLARTRLFRHLRDVEGTTLNSGRKTEVVLLRDMTINKVTNSARQIFSKVVGLTINESSEGGLQMNVGGRGLNPNRTANFNTRQNGYDISADVLGYPESYYTPPAEALREIRVIRGAASLQYGTQFGGLLDFKMNRPSFAPWKLEQRCSYGSENLLASFTSLSGTLNKFSYYSYFNYKQGNGFRPNSQFRLMNGFANLNYNWGKNKLSLDWVKYHYLAHQAGGLTDFMFYQNPLQSNRKRNWFRVDWNVLSLKYAYLFNPKTRFSLNLFGLMADRSALGYRSNRISQDDDPNLARDLLIGRFKNWGLEARMLTAYELFGQNCRILGGFKYYQSLNSSQQGEGAKGDKADFVFVEQAGSSYPKKSKFTYPNLNFAFFVENIFHLGKRTTLTPGLRAEWIRTESRGAFTEVFTHPGLAPQYTLKKDNVVKSRPLLLLGLAFAHKQDSFELYANLSQNYRSVTFSDIHSITPGFAISPSISDEKGFSSDLGLRGRWANFLSYDCSAYVLYYGNKIGEYFHENARTGAVERYRDNVGTALTYGFEAMLNWSINNTFFQREDILFNLFVNTAFTGSQYLSSKVPNIQGNRVEFVPLFNLKTGLEFGWNAFKLSTQISYVSEQFAEATNQRTDPKDNLYGVFGQIPAYYVWDASCSYEFNKHIRLEATLQNITNHAYFTQRATGYPGPGIIPSAPFNFVTTLALSL